MKKTIQLDLETIIRECSLNPDLKQDHFYFFSISNRENIHEIFKYKKFNEDFTSKLSCYNTGEHIIGHIRPSYDEFLEKLIIILGVNCRKPIEDNDDLTSKMLDRIERLKTITTEAELKEEFPILYNDLINGRSYYNGLQLMRLREKYSDEQVANGEHYYYGCALKKSLKNFITTQSKMYTRYVTDRKKLKELQEKKNYNGYIRKHFDSDKLYMYVIHEYLSHCEEIEDLDELNYYLKLIEQYLSSTINKNISITTKEGIHIDIANIRKRYENLKKKCENKHSIVEWVLLPEDKDYTSVKQTSPSRTIRMSQKRANKLRKAGEKKKNYYSTSPYIIKAIGLKKYRGYIAYIYENGEIILDREYNSVYPSTAEGDAIYNIKVEDFETLSKESKSFLVGHPRVRRIIHTKDWQSKVDNIINRPGTPEEKEKTKQLIKRLQEKKK